MNKQYVLKNKDIEVLRFNVETIENLEEDIRMSIPYIASIEILMPNLIPKSLKLNSDDKDVEKLEKWIENRKVPKNRAFVEHIISAIDNKNFLSYVDVTFALSLNDTFWITPSNNNYQWEDYNLYTNSFNETLALVAFTGYSTTIKGLITSPELTTNGMLKKCWHRNKESNKIELLKGQTQAYANRGKEAYCEYYMAQIAQALEFEHITYDLKQFHKQLVSSCEIFTNEKYGYISMYDCIEDSELFSKKNTFKLIATIKEIYTENAFNDLMLFDALICNTDRHLGNYGMLIDNDTNKLVKPAPIFDNGLSFFNHITEHDLKDIASFVKTQVNAMDFSFLEQIRQSGQKRHIKNLSKLSNFTFKRHEKYNLPEEWLKLGEKFIQQRSLELIKVIEKKLENKLDLNHNKNNNTPLNNHSNTPRYPNTPHNRYQRNDKNNGGMEM
ncbi:transcriptional regulator [Helicobacter cetorum]|uniref:transcriptional regulator n=1 Tax=Helicobacter cetorum TaxID=138563 RepID=UPI000CF16422|nr:transcriptional regulator [Helicobacter cetorum]